MRHATATAMLTLFTACATAPQPRPSINVCQPLDAESARRQAKLDFAAAVTALNAADFEGARVGFERAFHSLVGSCWERVERSRAAAALARNTAYAAMQADQPYTARLWLRRYFRLLPEGQEPDESAYDLSWSIASTIEDDYNALGVEAKCSRRAGCWLGVWGKR